MGSGIYMIENVINGKKYIGSAVNINKRWYQHRYTLNRKIHDNSYLQNAWNKYGEENFEFIILEETEYSNLIDREQFYIDSYDVIKFGYNLAPTDGNTLGFKFTEESRLKMSLKKKGKPSTRKNYKMSEETKKKISEANKISQKGRKHSEETKGKMSEKRKGSKMSKESKKKLSDFRKGKILSEETKKKISLTKMNNKHALGMTHTIETKKKIGFANKRKNRGENNGMSITTKKEVFAIRNDYDNGMKISELQLKYDKKYMFIYKIIKRLTWKWLDNSSFTN